MSVSKHCKGCGKAIRPKYANDRRLKWCSDRCRKRTLYSGTCAVCGAWTQGTASGYSRASVTCPDCAPEFYRRWTEERIIRAIREWAKLTGLPPSASAWNAAPSVREKHPTYDWEEIDRLRAEGHYPSTINVQQVFGSWSAGLRAAGFESKVGYYLRELNMPRKPQSAR